MGDNKQVNVITLSVHHAEHGLPLVEHAAKRCHSMLEHIYQCPAVDGVVLLSTCNRVELFIDIDDTSDESERTRANLVAHVAKLLELDAVDGERPVDDLSTSLATHSSISTYSCPRLRTGRQALRHIFTIACGLDSMVVGEREISGQMRRALTVALSRNTSSPTLTRVIQHALRTSRVVAQLTGLSSQGRSVVSCGLDLVHGVMASEGMDSTFSQFSTSYFPRTTRALLIGTGAYAGATVAALRGRCVSDISVYSPTGRAQQFAEGHELKAVDGHDLVDSLVHSDIVVTCSGHGTPVITYECAKTVSERRPVPLIVVDLSLQDDVDLRAEKLANLHVITLDTIRRHVPQVAKEHVLKAQQIVEQGVDEAIATIRERSMDKAVMAVRNSIQEILESELQALPQGQMLARETVEKALRHFAARIAHTPSVKARQAAQDGREKEFVQALADVMDVHLENISN